MDFPLINEINDNTNAAAEAVKTAILNAMPAAGIDQAALDAAVAEILAGMPTGGGLTSCIRKISRGVGTRSRSAETVEIALSGFTDLNKMIPIINVADNKDGHQGLRIASLTKTKLTLEAYDSDNTYGSYFSYQVIEFY